MTQPTSQNSDCVFCKIADGRIPSQKIYEDASVFCIRDIQPQAKAHLLVIPKRHVASLEALFSEGSDLHGAELMGRIFEVALKVARQEGLLPNGFRTVINTNDFGGQTVHHLHVHLLGGQAMPGHFGA